MCGELVRAPPIMPKEVVRSVAAHQGGASIVERKYVISKCVLEKKCPRSCTYVSIDLHFGLCLHVHRPECILL